jgi:hypothetical protein
MPRGCSIEGGGGKEHGIWNESDDITYGKRGKHYLIFFGDDIFWEGGGGWLGGSGV